MRSPLAFKRLELRYDRTTKGTNTLALLAVTCIAARLLVHDCCIDFSEGLRFFWLDARSTTSP